MPSNLSHIQLFSTGLKTPLPPRPTKPSSRPSFSTSVKHRTRSIPVFESSLNEEILWRIHSCIWSISRQLSNQESCRRIRFFDGNYIDSYEFYFIFFFLRRKVWGKKRDFKTIKRTRPKKEMANRIRWIELKGKLFKSGESICQIIESSLLDENTWCKLWIRIV